MNHKLLDEYVLNKIKNEIISSEEFKDRSIEDRIYILDLIEWAIGAYYFNYFQSMGGKNDRKSC